MKKYILSWIVISILIFLIFLPEIIGSWMYLDNSHIPYLKDWLFSINSDFLYSIKLNTWFWLDNTQIWFTRIFNAFQMVFWQYFLYGIFFLINFVFSFKILRIFFEKDAAIFWSLIFTFNPVSVYFLNLSWFIFAYSSLVITVFWFYKYIKSKRLFYLILIILGWITMISYTRVFWLYLSFLIIIWLIYFHELKVFILENKKLCLFSWWFIILIFLPFFFSFIYPILTGSNEYFKWVANYASAFNSDFLYNGSKNTPLYKTFQLQELTSNFASWFKNNFIYTIFFISFTLYWIVWTWLNKGNNNKLINILLFTFIILILIRWWWYFLSKDLFLDIAYKYYPFIANNTKWLMLIYIPILSFLYGNLINNKKDKFILKIIVIFFVLLSILPLLTNFVFQNNYKLSPILKKEIPIEYREEFLKKSSKKELSLFFPANNIYFNWSPYPININNNTSYKTLLSNNVRQVNRKQVELFKKVSEFDKNIQNTRIFNNKTFFIFKDINHPSPGYFDVYTRVNLEEKSNNTYNFIRNNRNHLYIEKDNNNFTKVKLKNYDHYDFLLYSPKNIIKKNIIDLYSKEIDINLIPLIIDKNSFNLPKELDDSVSYKENNIRIDYKKLIKNPTKFYIKISNQNQNNDFLIQLNRTFGLDWKLKWINKKDYLRYKCIEKPIYYKITNNSSCEIDDWYLDSLLDIKYINKKSINNSHHFEWNFIGNTWLVKQDDIPNEMKWTSELYAVLIYQKQFWYILSLMISAWSFWILLILVLIQESYIFMKKNEK